MKTTYTANYYKSNYETFLNNPDGYSRRYYMNLEKDLNDLMKPFKESGLAVEAVEGIKKIYAEKVAATAKKELLNTKAMVERLQTGKSTLGFTSMRQEINAKHDIIQRFEFNCYQLSVFKKKYNIN